MPKIFESPDGGKTVYSRQFGESERDLEWENPGQQRASELLKEKQEWSKIIEAAKSNSALQEAIDRVKLIYHLSNKDG
jgi:hypothetical protein